ncbi:Tfp pilus assembly protein [Vibrio cholerae]|nr:Tfp pilus assembly protein [Vibrio cholerae]
MSRTINSGQLTLIVLSFGSLLHSFWCWTCACKMHLRKMLFK